MIKDLLRSSPFRITLLFLLFFAFSSAVMLTLIYISASHEFKKTLQNQVLTESEVLHRIFDFKGNAELMTTIQARTNAPGTATFIYALLDRHGTEVIGNLPVNMLKEGWSETTVKTNIVDPGDEGESELVTYGTRLSNGGLVIVGAGLDQTEDLRNIIVQSLISSLALMLPLSLGAGILLSRAALARISAIHHTTRQIMAGDLSQRLPAGNSKDEFDRLSVSINDMLERIEELMSTMKQVTTDIAHDLRTPLGRLRQGLESAQAGPSTVESCLEALEKAKTETDQILRTFDALLQIGQINTLDLRKRFTKVNFSALAAQLAESYQPVAAEKGQNFKSFVVPGLYVRGHNELLAQLLVNLIENAINHCPPGATITIRAGIYGGAVVAGVADNGPGIPPEHRKKIFQPFYRLERSRKTPGSGLGMSLVRSIASIHGINIALGDNGPGLTVRLTFPKRSGSV